MNAIIQRVGEGRAGWALAGVGSAWSGGGASWHATERAAASLWISSSKNREKLIKQGPIMQKISLNRMEYMQANYSFGLLEFVRCEGQLLLRYTF